MMKKVVKPGMSSTSLLDRDRRKRNKKNKMVRESRRRNRGK